MIWTARFFSLDELTRSETAQRLGIDNTPPEAIVAHLHETGLGMDRVRLFLSGPCLVSSAYRAWALNHAVGGSPTSAHPEGWAVDFTCPSFGPPKAICEAIARHSGIRFDQLIVEPRWVHISFDPRLRGITRTAVTGAGGRIVRYREGL